MSQSLVIKRPSPVPKLDTAEPSIRLLKAQNVADETRFCYVIQTFRLTKCPSYKALSYTWGNPFPPDQIINGIGQKVPPDDEFQDRCRDWGSRNMAHFLQRRPCDGFLWIDRICIDQDNNHEKSNQLGRHGTDSAPAMQVQNNFAGPSYDLSEQGELTEEDLQKHTPGDPGSHVDYHCAFLAKFGLDITMTATWFDWCQFFRRTWFYRSWTLQETSLARDIHVLCGNHQFNWYKLKFLVKYFQNSGWDSYLKALLGVEIDNLPRRAFYAREIAVPGLLGVELWKEELIRAYGVSSSGSSLTEFLYRNSMLQCSEPRDIVFALLSIPKGTNQPSHLATINVDYTSNTNANYIGVPSNEIKMGDPIWLIVRTKIFPRAKYGQSSDCCMAKIKSLLEQCI